MGDDEMHVHRAAILALGELGPGGAPFSGKIAEQLTSSEIVMQCAAAMALGKLEGHIDSDVVVYIGKLLWINDTVRCAATDVLAKLGRHAAPFVGKIAQLLEDDDPRVRLAAIDALGKLREFTASFGPCIV